MSEPIFSGKIYCGICGWKYRSKKERSKQVYVCSKYSIGKSGGCERHKVDEEHLKTLVERQLVIYQLPKDRLDLVEAVIVTRGDLKIYYTGFAPTVETQKNVTFGIVGQHPEECPFCRVEA